MHHTTRQRSPLALFALLALSAAAARAAPPEIPEAHIPGSVVLELRGVEHQFDQALSQDCAIEHCLSKGCTYTAHVTVDLPRSSSLPGLPADQGPGSVAPQDYLTGARCEFAYEKTVSSHDVQALAHRLEQRLSRGFLKVTVDPQPLEPVSKALRESPKPPEPEKPPTPPTPEPPKPAEPPPWTIGTGLLELWHTLVPHSPWMSAILLLTLATLILIWGARRLGSESVEEKLLQAQLAKGGQAGGAAPDAAAVDAATVEQKADDEGAFAAEQEKLWSERIEAEEKGHEDTLFKGILRQWLRAGELPLLARAVQLFGDRISLAFASDPDLAMRKVELAEYLRDVEEESLPSRADFFRRLNQHAISSALLAQSDVELYRSLREELGSQGLLELMEELPQRYGAVAFALSSPERQLDTVQLMSDPLRAGLCEELLASSRVAPEELAHLLQVLEAIRGAKPLPPAPKGSGISDRGLEIDAAGALSVLLPALSEKIRVSLFSQALARSGGVAPRWYETIFYRDMLAHVPPDVKKELVLEVDVRGLAAWTSLQPPVWQKPFLDELSPSLREALHGNMGFSSRTEQLRQARKGQADVVTALQRRFVKGRLSFTELVGS